MHIIRIYIYINTLEYAMHTRGFKCLIRLLDLIISSRQLVDVLVDSYSIRYVPYPPYQDF